MENILVPPASKGKQTDLQEAVTLPNREQALDAFRRAGKRMLNPKVWHQLSGKASAAFLLTGPQGEEEHRLARKNDYFRIDIPGPGSAAGDGYDWVRVELVDDQSNPGGEEESIGLKVRASAQPGKEEKGTAHFFKDDATSTFIIRREGNTVISSYHGRNEQVNAATEKISDNIRNSAVALGAVAGLSELQWSSLIKAFLQEEIGG